MVVNHWLQKLFPQVQFPSASAKRRNQRANASGGTHSEVGIVRTSEALEDRTLLSTFYVDDTFSSAGNGVDPDGDGPATSMGDDSFSTLQEALDVSADGDVIIIGAGNYAEDISVTTDVSIIGATGVAGDIVITGAGFTIAGSADVSISDLTVSATGDAFSIDAVGSSASLSLDHVVADGAGDDGLSASASNGGSVMLSVIGTTFNGAAGNAIHLASSTGGSVVLSGSEVSGASAGVDGIHAASDGGSISIDLTEVGSFAGAGEDGVDISMSNGAHPDVQFNISGTSGSKADFSGAGRDGLRMTYVNYVGFNESDPTFTITDASFDDAGRDGLSIVSTGSTPGSETTFNGEVVDSTFDGAGQHGFSATISGNTPKSAISFVDSYMKNSGVDAIHIEASDNSFFDIDIIDGNLTGSGDDNVDIDQDSGSTIDIFIDPTPMDRGFEFDGADGTVLQAHLLDSPLSTMDEPAVNGIRGTLQTGATMNLIVENSEIENTTRDGMNVLATGGSVFNATFINSHIENSGRVGAFIDLREASRAVISFEDGSYIRGTKQSSNLFVSALDGSFANIDFDETSGDLSDAGRDGIFVKSNGTDALSGDRSTVFIDFAGMANLDDAGRDGMSLNSNGGGLVRVQAYNGLSVDNAQDNAVAIFGIGADTGLYADNVSMANAGGHAFRSVVGSGSRVITRMTNVAEVSSTNGNGIVFNSQSSFHALNLSGTDAAPMVIGAPNGTGIKADMFFSSTSVLRFTDFEIDGTGEDGIALSIDDGLLSTSYFNDGVITNNGQNGGPSAGISVNLDNNANIGPVGSPQLGLTMNNLEIGNTNALKSQDVGFSLVTTNDSDARIRMTNSSITQNDGDGVFVDVNPDQSPLDSSFADLTFGLVDINDNCGDGVNLTANFGTSSPLDVNSGIEFNFNGGNILRNGNGVLNDGIGDGVDVSSIGDPGEGAGNTTVVLNLNNATIGSGADENEEDAIRLNAQDGGTIIQGVTGGEITGPVTICADGAASFAALTLDNVLINPSTNPMGDPDSPAIAMQALNGASVSGTFKNMNIANGTEITGHGAQAFVFDVQSGGQLEATFENVDMVANLDNAAIIVDPKTGLPVNAAIQGNVTDAMSNAIVSFTDVTVTDHRLNGFEIDVLNGANLDLTIENMTLANNMAAAGEGEFDIDIDGADSTATIDIDGLTADGSTGVGINIDVTNGGELTPTQFNNISANGAIGNGFDLVVDATSTLNPLTIENSSFNNAIASDGINIDVLGNTTATEVSIINTTVNDAGLNAIDINILDAKNGTTVVNIDSVTALSPNVRGLDIDVLNLGATDDTDIDITGISDFTDAGSNAIDVRVDGVAGSTAAFDVSGVVTADNAVEMGVNLNFTDAVQGTVNVDGLIAQNAGNRGFSVQSPGAASVVSVDLLNSNLDDAGTKAVFIHIVDQAITTAINIDSVSAVNAGDDAIDINLIDVAGPAMDPLPITLNDVTADGAGASGFELWVTGTTASEDIPVELTNSTFNDAGEVGMSIILEGDVGTSATVTMTDTTATNADLSGLVIDATNDTELPAVTLTNVDVSGADNDLDGTGDGLIIDIDAQTVAAVITFDGVNANDAGERGMYIGLDGVVGDNVVNLNNVNARNALNGHGLHIDSINMGAMDTIDIDITNDIGNGDFSGALMDAVHFDILGVIGTTATLDIDGLIANDAGDDGIDLVLDNGVEATVGTFDNVSAMSNEENGLKVSVTGGATLTDFIGDGLDFSGNATAGAGFDGIDVSVSGVDSEATFNLSNLTVNNSGGRGIDLDVFDNGNLTFNVTGMGNMIDMSGLGGLDINVGSTDAVSPADPPVSNGVGTFSGTFENLDITNSGQSLVFTADGVNIDTRNAGTTADITFTNVTSDNNDDDGFDILVIDQAVVDIAVDEGSTGSSNAGKGFTLLASGLGTEVTLTSDPGVSMTNSSFDNNTGGPGFEVILEDQVLVNDLTINASASNNLGDGVRVIANDGSGVEINGFGVAGDNLQVNNNDGNGLFVDFKQVIGISDFALEDMTVSGNGIDQIFVRIEGTTATPMSLGNFQLHNITAEGTAGSDDGIEIQLIDTEVTGMTTAGTPPAVLAGFSVFNVHSSMNGGFGLNLIVSEDPEGNPIAPATTTSSITSGIITQSEFDSNARAGVRMQFGGDSTHNFEIFDNTSGFHDNGEQGILIEVQDFATFEMTGNNPLDADPLTRSFYNNMITNNDGVGFHLIASEPNDPDFFFKDGDGPRYDLELGDILRNPNTITGNRDAGMAIIGGGDSTGTFEIVNSIMSNTTNGPDMDLNGDGLVIRLNEYGELESLDVDGTSAGLDLNNNAGSGLVTSVNEDGLLGTVTPVRVVNTTILDNSMHGIDVQRRDDGLYGPDPANHRIIIGETGAGNTIEGNSQNGINIINNNQPGAPIPFQLNVTANMISDNLDGIFVRGTGNAQVTGHFSDNIIDDNNQDGVNIQLENDASFGNPAAGSDPFILDGNQVTNNSNIGYFFDTNFTNENGNFGGGAFVNVHIRDSDTEVDTLGDAIRANISGNGQQGIHIIDNSDFTGGAGTVVTQNTYKITAADINNNGFSTDNGNGIFAEIGERQTRDLNNGVAILIGDASQTTNNRDVMITGNADDGIDLEFRDSDIFGFGTQYNLLTIDRTTVAGNGASGDNQRNEKGPQNVGHGIEIEVGEGNQNATDSGLLISRLTHVDVLGNFGDGIDYFVTSRRGTMVVADTTFFGVNASQNNGRGLDVYLRHDPQGTNSEGSRGISNWYIGRGDELNNGDLINRFNENDREGIVFESSARVIDDDTVNVAPNFPHYNQTDINNDVFVEVNLPPGTIAPGVRPSTKHGFGTLDAVPDPDEFTIEAIQSRGTRSNPAGTETLPVDHMSTRGDEYIHDIDGTDIHVQGNIIIANSEIANNGGFASFEDGLDFAIGAMTRMNVQVGNVSFGGNFGDDLRIFPQMSVDDNGAILNPPQSFIDGGTGHDHSYLVYDPVSYIDFAFGVVDDVLLDDVDGIVDVDDYATAWDSIGVTAGNGMAANTATGGGGNGDQVFFYTSGTNQTSQIANGGLYTNNDPMKGSNRPIQLAGVALGADRSPFFNINGGADDNAVNAFEQNGVMQDINILLSSNAGWVSAPLMSGLGMDIFGQMTAFELGLNNIGLADYDRFGGY